MKIGLYFGTFNPIHVGHLIIANHIVQYTNLDKIWFVVSPQNPLKKRKTLLADYHRLHLVQEAIEDNDYLHACNIEFQLPKPSYTIHTLTYLIEKHPNIEFSLIMGEDNLRVFHKWKNFEIINKNYKIFVYPRLETIEEKKMNLEKIKQKNLIQLNHVYFVNAPIIKISSSFIRENIKNGKDVRYLLTHPVLQYITEMNFYK